jgi:hypothetical protein
MECGLETKERMLMAAGSASKVVNSMPLVIATASYLCTKFADEPFFVIVISRVHFASKRPADDRPPLLHHCCLCFNTRQWRDIAKPGPD